MNLLGLFLFLLFLGVGLLLGRSLSIDGLLEANSWAHVDAAHLLLDELVAQVNV